MLNTFSVKYNQHMSKSGTYRIDLGGGWFYVGSATDLNRRRSSHENELRRGVHCNHIMQRVFDKHGGFEFTVLGRYPTGQIIEREQLLLDEHCGDPKCANLAVVAGSPMAGRKASDETRAKVSAALRGRKVSTETRAKISSSTTGREVSEVTRTKLSASLKGRIISTETRAKISAAKTGRKASAAHCAAIGAASKGRKVSPETRAKISAANSGWCRDARDNAPIATV